MVGLTVFAVALLPAALGHLILLLVLSALRASAHRCCLLFAQALIGVVRSSRKRSSVLSALRASAHRCCLLFAQALIAVGLSPLDCADGFGRPAHRSFARGACLVFGQRAV